VSTIHGNVCAAYGVTCPKGKIQGGHHAARQAGQAGAARNGLYSSGMHCIRQWCAVWRRAVVIALLLVGVAAMPVVVVGQTPPPDPVTAAPSVLMELRLKDGSVFYGTVERETPERVVLRTIAGATVEVDRAQIASIEPARGAVVAGEFIPADPNATRLLFSPTARSLEQGQGYLGVYEFVLPFVQVGVTDRFSIGVGTPLVFWGDEDVRPIWVTPKYQFYNSGRVQAAAGLMHFHVLGDDTKAGLAYAVATIGTHDSAWTVGTGWAYSRYYDEIYDCTGPMLIGSCELTREGQTEGSPVVLIGAEHRLGRRAKVITENYAFEGGGIVSAGVRFLGDRLSADLGLAVPIGTDGFIALPVVNFVWTFGR
jgi:hypothetical protein